MKRKISIFLIAVLVLSAFNMTFAEPRYVDSTHSMFFSGTTVECYCRVSQSNANISLIMKLYQDNRVVETWYDSGTGNASLNEEFNGRSGSTYKLAVTYSIDGTRYSMPTITKVCP